MHVTSSSRNTRTRTYRSIRTPYAGMLCATAWTRLTFPNMEWYQKLAAENNAFVNAILEANQFNKVRIIRRERMTQRKLLIFKKPGSR